MKRSELKNQYKQFLFCEGFADWGNDLWFNETKCKYPEHALTEGSINTLSAEQVRDQIIQYFSLSPSQVFILGNGNVAIYTPDLEHNLELLKYRMKFGGWFLSQSKDITFKASPERWKIYVFEPRFRDETNIRSEEKTLLHVTPERNINDILEEGLKPRNSNIDENNRFDYPSRVYLFRGSISKERLKILYRKVS